MSEGIRIGHGYDIHRLTAGRKLFLGGIEIPFEKGEDAHSDGDVLLHAIIDSLLGASASGDIGTHFPPNDDSYKNISSRVLLRRTAELLGKRGYAPVNIDASVILEGPKIGPYIIGMRETIARDLGIEVERVSVKGKTAEKTGAVGEGRAVEAHAVCLIRSL